MISSMKRCMRDQGVLNEEDRISQLPEALILHILSLLPTKDVLATTVLSKQWRFLWKMVPKLTFDYCDHKREPGTFSKDVLKTLISHKAPVLQSLHLEVDLDTCTPMDIGILLGIAFGRNVRELLLDVYPEKKMDRSLVFPTSFFYTCETLETLILRFIVLVDVPSQICLKSLKTLHLDYLDYEGDGEDSVINLLSACPCLQNLVLMRSSDSIRNFTIAVESLESLLIDDENYRKDHCSYYIIAPSLKNLHIEVEEGSVLCVIDNSPKLEKAKIVCETIDEKLLLSLTSVKMLSLLLWSPLEVEYRSRRHMFYSLVHLEIYTGKPAWWNLLTSMLKTSPKLKVLKLLFDKWHTIEDHVECENWNQPSIVPECLMFHLETFVWEGYKGKREEKKVAAYVFKNASRLKNATFFQVSSERFKEVKRMVKASKLNCQVVFEEQNVGVF